jgi:hypothetical protein
VRSGLIRDVHAAHLRPHHRDRGRRHAPLIASTSPYAVSYPRLSFGIANDERDV